MNLRASSMNLNVKTNPNFGTVDVSLASVEKENLCRELEHLYDDASSGGVLVKFRSGAQNILTGGIGALLTTIDYSIPIVDQVIKLTIPLYVTGGAFIAFLVLLCFSIKRKEKRRSDKVEKFVAKLSWQNSTINIFAFSATLQKDEIVDT